ncbi:hypothetical protein ABEB36_001864 [Hypothenemus hampei]|uniref:PAXIP1-associated glutamate-rich protein 1 n=1 Tax=Hypothenemus hampei TaxID=57062 RepID=A0ABD1FG09_HYPHA
MESIQENWSIECSDDELKNEPDPWDPPPEVIDKIYTALAKGEVPTLKWTCPGYRSPSPVRNQEPEEEEAEIKKEDEQDDFDFMDEMTSPKLKIRQKSGETLKGSAKKKTTSLDGVINNMRRHHLLSSTTNK